MSYSKKLDIHVAINFSKCHVKNMDEFQEKKELIIDFEMITLHLSHT
jgi:hypothetical protein